MKSFLCEILFSCALAVAGAKSLDELTYGTALYAYYQEDYAQALLEVMVAERQERLGADPVRFELAKGSFAFQERMHRWSAEVLNAVPAGELSNLDRMRLAFHRARLHHRAGDWAAMNGELAHVDLGSNWRGRQRHHPEVRFMRAEAAVAREDFAAAEEALSVLDRRDPELAYGLFNLGVARRAAGDAVAAKAAFARLADLEPRQPEAWDVIQRGRLALAMLARHGGEPMDARRVLAALPAGGRYRELALGSYAGLAGETGDHELAARIWLTVLEQPGWSRSHAAAHLGLPASLEAFAAPAHALTRYRDAERAFEARLAALESVAARADDAGWIDGLLAAHRGAAADAGSWGEVLGVGAWSEWLAGEDVHRLLQEWRELADMAAWLDELPARIAAFQEITVERRRRTAEAGRLLGHAELPERRLALARRIGELEATLATLEGRVPSPDPAWMRLLADPQERALVEDLAAKTALAGRAPAPERDRLLARIDRLLGLAFWEIADDRAARIRVLSSALDDSRALLAEVDQRMQRLAGAEARFAAGVETDFLILAQRVDAMAMRVAEARDDRRRQVADAFRRGLEQEMVRTRQYLLAARMAVARTTDRLASAAATPGSDS